MTQNLSVHASAQPTLQFANFRFSGFFPVTLHQVWEALDALFAARTPFVILGREAKIVIAALQKRYLDRPILRESSGRSPYMVVFYPDGEVRYKLDIIVPESQRGVIIGFEGQNVRPIINDLRKRNISVEVRTYRTVPSHVHVSEIHPNVYRIEIVRMCDEVQVIERNEIVCGNNGFVPTETDNIVFEDARQARIIAELYADAYSLHFNLPVAWE